MVDRISGWRLPRELAGGPAGAASRRRCGPRSASAAARRRTGSWWGWRCWGWCRRSQASGRWCAWSMMSSGWTGPRCRRWGLWRGGWRPSRWGLVFAARVPGAELAGLPELAVAGLREEDARALLDSALTGPLDARVRDLIVAETRGNPLALLELPRGLGSAELAGGFGLPAAVSLPGRIEDSFRRQPWRVCRPRRGGCSRWRRRIRRVICCWCGGPRRGWGSPHRRGHRP